MILIELRNKIFGCRNFEWHEALWLPTWQVAVFPTNDVKRNIEDFAQIMEQIRGIFGQPITVHSWYRPPIYNREIGGAGRSAHMEGIAVDFSVYGFSCDYVRSHLLPHLDGLNIRMEKKPGSDWVHVDSRDPGPSGRYFVP